MNQSDAPAIIDELCTSLALRCVRIFPGVNSRAELVTLAPGLRPERRFAPLARGLNIFLNFSRLCLSVSSLVKREDCNSHPRLNGSY